MSWPEPEPVAQLNWNETTGGGCVQDSKLSYLGLMCVGVVAMTVNVAVWLAATVYREKLLRQTYAYTCVTSTLLSNCVFLSFNLWDEVEGYFRPELASIGRPGGKMQILWTLCVAASVCSLFMMCGNLTVLIYVMLDSTNFQLSARHQSWPATSPQPAFLAENPKLSTHRSRLEQLESKRRKATFLMTCSWLIPFVLTVVAVLRWNCAELCGCGPGVVGESCPAHDGCSRVWAPLSNSFMAVNVSLWAVEITCLITLVVRGVLKNRAYHAAMLTSVRQYRARVLSSNNAATELSSPASMQPQDVARAPSPDDVFDSRLDVSDDVEKTRTMSSRTRRVPSNPRLRLVAILTAVFVTCTAPVAVAFAYDFAADELPAVNASRVPVMVLVHVYTLLCPLVLLKYLSGLKSSLLQLVGVGVSCCGAKRSRGRRSPVRGGGGDSAVVVGR